MNKHALVVRAVIGGAGAALLVASAGTAFAAQVGGDDQVGIDVDIDAVQPVGALTMSLASTTTALKEVDSASTTTRSFTGELPRVTVTDDRSEVPAGVGWYVLGQASDLASSAGGTKIGPENLGWTPALVSGNDGSVAAGDQTVPQLDAPTNAPADDNNVGLKGKELLAITATSSADAKPTGTWTADADLKLTTPADVVPGAYSGAITLTLWED